MEKEVKQDKFFFGIPMAKEPREAMDSWLGKEPEYTDDNSVDTEEDEAL